jgi:hypothetical protein
MAHEEDELNEAHVTLTEAPDDGLQAPEVE